MLTSTGIGFTGSSSASGGGVTSTLKTTIMPEDDVVIDEEDIGESSTDESSSDGDRHQVARAEGLGIWLPFSLRIGGTLTFKNEIRSRCSAQLNSVRSRIQRERSSAATASAVAHDSQDPSEGPGNRHITGGTGGPSSLVPGATGGSAGGPEYLPASADPHPVSPRRNHRSWLTNVIENIERRERGISRIVRSTVTGEPIRVPGGTGARGGMESVAGPPPKKKRGPKKQNGEDEEDVYDYQDPFIDDSNYEKITKSLFKQRDPRLDHHDPAAAHRGSHEHSALDSAASSRGVSDLPGTLHSEAPMKSQSHRDESEGRGRGSHSGSLKSHGAVENGKRPVNRNRQGKDGPSSRNRDANDDDNMDDPEVDTVNDADAEDMDRIDNDSDSTDNIRNSHDRIRRGESGTGAGASNLDVLRQRDQVKGLRTSNSNEKRQNVSRAGNDQKIGTPHEKNASPTGLKGSEKLKGDDGVSSRARGSLPSGSKSVGPSSRKGVGGRALTDGSHGSIANNSVLQVDETQLSENLETENLDGETSDTTSDNEVSSSRLSQNRSRASDVRNTTDAVADLSGRVQGGRNPTGKPSKTANRTPLTSSDDTEMSQQWTAAPTLPAYSVQSQQSHPHSRRVMAVSSAIGSVDDSATESEDDAPVHQTMHSASAAFGSNRPGVAHSPSASFSQPTNASTLHPHSSHHTNVPAHSSSQPPPPYSFPQSQGGPHGMTPQARAGSDGHPGGGDARHRKFQVALESLRRRAIKNIELWKRRHTLRQKRLSRDSLEPVDLNAPMLCRFDKEYLLGLKLAAEAFSELKGISHSTKRKQRKEFISEFVNLAHQHFNRQYVTLDELERAVKRAQSLSADDVADLGGSSDEDEPDGGPSTLQNPRSTGSSAATVDARVHYPPFPISGSQGPPRPTMGVHPGDPYAPWNIPGGSVPADSTQSQDLEARNRFAAMHGMYLDAPGQYGGPRGVSGPPPPQIGYQHQVYMHPMYAAAAAAAAAGNSPGHPMYVPPNGAYPMMPPHRPTPGVPGPSSSDPKAEWGGNFGALQGSNQRSY